MFASFPKAQYQAYRSEIDAAIARVLDSGSYIMGTEVKAFEEEFATYIGLKHAIGVGSGTDALTLSLMALDIGVGDEVITVPYTFVATVGSIVTAGATPVFVDIKKDYNIDENKIESAITKKTKAIMPVHWAGRPCNLEKIYKLAKKNNLKIIQKDFLSESCNEKETLSIIKKTYEESNIILDPHTAVGVGAAKKLSFNDCVVLSTAHPCKFPDATNNAINKHEKLPEELQHVLDKEENFKVLKNNTEEVKNFVKSKV